MTSTAVAPRGLRWTEQATVKALATLAAYIAIAAAVLLGVRGQAYVTCVGDSQQRAAERAFAIAAATDAERAAQRRLVVVIGDPQAVRQAQAEALAAYDHTDAVRKAYPAPPAKRC